MTSILRTAATGIRSGPGLRAPVVALVTASLFGAGLAVAVPSGASPTATVTSTSTTRVAPNTTGALGGLSVSNVSVGNGVQVTLSTSVGTVSITATSGVTLSYNNHASGDPSITFTGSEANVNAALATAALTTGNNAGATAKVSLTAMPSDDDHVYLAPNQHFYEYVPMSSGITWSAADAAAKTKSFAGQRGYLATIPNSTVNDFISSKIKNATNIWFGARAYHDSDPSSTRAWRWAAGNDESPINNQPISYCSNAADTSCNFSNNAGLYNSWASGEPNNYAGTEDYAVTNWQGSSGEWNDLKDDAPGIGGYVVEYGDLATGSTGFSGVQTASSSVEIAGAPNAPTSVSASALNASARVTFAAPANNGSAITGYTVTSSPGGITATCASSPCTVTGLTNGTAYTFTVFATNAVGNGPTSSATASVTPKTVPGAPTGVSATRGDAKATVSFTAPADNGGAAITSYTVSSAPGGLTTTCPGSPCTVTGLTNGTSYTFTVVATNAAGSGAPSASSAAVTPATVPGAPTHVVATRGSGSASVTFDAPVSNGGSAITTYTVTSSPGGQTASCDGLSACIVPGLTDGTSYTFTVTATNAVGVSNPSAASNSVTPASKPDAPAITSVTSNDGSLTVAFTAPGSDGSDAITRYEYSIDGTTWHTLTTSGTGPFTGVIPGLTNGTAYPVRVRAVNGVGDGAASPTVTATPATTPGVPTALSTTVDNGAVTVTWQAPHDGGAPITGYVVTAAPGGVTCTTTGVTHCTFPNLPAGRAYTFSVTATNANGSSTATGIGSGTASAPSGSTMVSGLASEPRNVRAVPGDRVLKISWNAPSDNGGAPITGYRVSIDGGRHWLRADSTTLTVPGVRNGATFAVVVRAVNVNGAGAKSAVATTATRQWFHDPRSPRTRKSEVAVPGKPALYRGPKRATRAAARSHNGTAAMPVSSLRGRQLQAGQAASLGTDALFAFDSSALNSAGKRSVRQLARSLRYVSAVVCEGYTDYGGLSRHQLVLSRQRAQTVCLALARAGAKIRMTTRGYAASRPVVVGGAPSDRAANRRVVLLVTK